MTPLKALITAALLATWLGAQSAALGEATHVLVNRQASELSGNFKNQLREVGFTQGVAANLRGNDGRTFTIRGWIEEGGEREDDSFRFFRHFHDPLKPWGSAGLDVGFYQFDSSIRWMHDQNSLVAFGGAWSWGDARRLYYEALTERDPTRREALWADLFRALGQLMHLVVDASVPEHARNDVHALGALKVANSYERWVGNQHGGLERDGKFIARYLSSPVDFLKDLLGIHGPSTEDQLVAPVVRLIDSDRYDGGNPAVTVDPRSAGSAVAVGLAEIANANFFTEDTLHGQYPSPTDAGLIPVNLATPQGRVRRYLSRPAGQGLLPAHPLRAECVLESVDVVGQLLRPSPYPCVDALVWEQVAAHMLPRAVGYARGVLDYFFRGSLRVRGVVVDNPVPGVDIAGRTGVWIDVENTSTERMEGVFGTYARLHRGTAQEQRFESGIVNAGGPVAIEPGATQRLRLTPIPGHATGSQVLVFRGRLGSEEDAVAGQVFSIPYIHVIQQSYDADISKTCTSMSSSSHDFPLDASLHCSWQPTNHRVSGALITNLRQEDAADPSAPAIDRIRAFWSGSVGGPARLTIDGVEHADGVWRRVGDEMNPSTFVVTDATARRDSRLVLGVSVRGHATEFTTQLATFTDTSHTSVEKRVFGAFSQEKWFVYRIRRTRIPLNMDARRHMTVAIGGYPSPAPLTVSGVHWQLPFFAHEAIQVTSVRADHTVIDPFIVVPMSQAADYTTPWAAIPLDVPFPSAPAVNWSAELRPRPLDAMTEQFWQTFVASEGPPADRLLLKGHEASP